MMRTWLLCQIRFAVPDPILPLKNCQQSKQSDGETLTKLDCQLGHEHKPRMMKMVFKIAVYLKLQKRRIDIVRLLSQT